MSAGITPVKGDIMTGRISDTEYSDAEADRRATDALRRALTTPHKSQQDLKVGRKAKRAPRKKSPKSPKSRGAV